MEADLILSWQRDPMKLKRDMWPHIEFYNKQIEIIYSVWENDETIVPAGNMLGKDFVAGFIALGWFITHDFVRVVTTSVKDDHLRVLWDEIDMYLSTSAIPLREEHGGPLRCNHRDIRKLAGTKVGVEKSYLVGMVAGKGEAMQGHHSPHSLLVVDEASGVDDIVYDMACTWLKKALIIGNPLPCANFFIKGCKAGDLVA